MYKTLFATLVALILTIVAAHAQGLTIIDGFALDSTIIRFNTGSIPGYIPDTAATPLWQAGLTHKSFFTSDTAGARAIMTDTINTYPANANNYFVLKVKSSFNTIIDVWHRYETDSFHAGDIIEFSFDTGMTWQNVKGECNTDSTSFEPGIRTDGLYSRGDTLFNGQPGFTGQNSSLYSRIQFFQGLPMKTTTPLYCQMVPDTIYIRFRFVSDTTTDTLAGWMIDSVKVERDLYIGAVPALSGIVHQVHPNPSSDGMYYFPAVPGEDKLFVTVYNAMGKLLYLMPYSHAIDLGKLPAGLYLYRVSDGVNYCSGRLLKE